MRNKVILGVVAAAALTAGISVLWPVIETKLTATTPATDAASRPANWAQPMTLDGVPNLHKIDDNLYRSAQPTAEGMKNLKKLGVKTIINLRQLHSDRDEIGDTGLGYVRIYSNAAHAEDEDVVDFLKTVTDKSRGPFLVHCQHGADRTGMMVAAYRIVICGWDREEAIRELTEGGTGFHETFQNIIKYLRELDVAQVKRDAGIGTAVTTGKSG